MIPDIFFSFLDFSMYAMYISYLFFYATNQIECGFFLFPDIDAWLYID